MIHELCVDGFSLEVEVTHCINTPPAHWSRDSDWDAQGEREIEFKVLSAVEYDEDGVKMHADRHMVANQYAKQIETALWFEIDSRAKRYRVAA